MSAPDDPSGLDHEEHAHDHIAEGEPDDNPETEELDELDDDGQLDQGSFTDDDIAAIDFSVQIPEDDGGGMDNDPDGEPVDEED